MRLLVLHGVADGFVIWHKWEITEVSFKTIVVRQYQASPMPSSKEPHLAPEL